MRKADVLRLKRGDEVVFGDSMWGAMSNYWLRGRVRFVTRNNGLRVELLDDRYPHDPTGGEMWVPYHHVHHVTKRGTKLHRRLHSTRRRDDLGRYGHD